MVQGMFTVWISVGLIEACALVAGMVCTSRIVAFKIIFLVRIHSPTSTSLHPPKCAPKSHSPCSSSGPSPLPPPLPLPYIPLPPPHQPHTPPNQTNKNTASSKPSSTTSSPSSSKTTSQSKEPSNPSTSSSISNWMISRCWRRLSFRIWYV